MTRTILDASALVALLMGEPGSDQVALAMEEGEVAMGAPNLAEVVGRLARSGVDPLAIQDALGALELDIIPLDAPAAWEAGLMEVRTRALGLSLGDRCCLALAEREGATVLTTDRAWMGWPGRAQVVCIR